MRGSLFVFILLLWKQERVGSIRLVELRVPGHAPAGGEALLGCQFDTSGDILYSVKWYKDGREFYRYVPRNKYPALNFATPGVYVDMSRSSRDVVTLVNLERESAGLYRCEVSGEAPLFTTTADERYINIHVLPKRGPQVSGLHHAYSIGDRVIANCTSGASSPEAQLMWLVNGKPVQRGHLRGPWYRLADSAGTAETILQLHFKIMPVHFQRGIMEVKCQAAIAPLYQQEILYRISEIDLDLPPLKEMIPTSMASFDYSKEDEDFRRNALYEIRQRLHRRLNVDSTSSESLLDIESVGIPVDNAKDLPINTSFKQGTTTSPNMGTLIQESMLLILVAFLNNLWHSLC